RAADVALAWNKGFAPRRFTLDNPPEDSPIFPFAPGLFGIGANLAVRAAAARAAGGFDEAMGPGTPTHGGEDCEFLVRMILNSYVLGYVPGAYLWHHHRPDAHALRAQMEGYAVGLGSFLAKVALSPQGRTAALRRLPAAVARLRHISAREAGAGEAMPADADQTRARGLLTGPRAYLQSRRAVRRAGGAVPPLVTQPMQAVTPKNPAAFGTPSATAPVSRPAAGREPGRDPVAPPVPVAPALVAGSSAGAFTAVRPVPATGSAATDPGAPAPGPGHAPAPGHGGPAVRT
ncbi:glycosyltransferase family 2 protein, partial [Pseudonocardia nematodicida]